MDTPLQAPRLKGFTLIEILVTLVIFSIGLLGLAGMQLRGSEGTNTAYFRSQATLIANDMAERMHANRAGVDANDYDSMDTRSVSCDNDPAPTPFCATRGGKPGISCTPEEMAFFDRFTIACSTQNLLPAGILTVTCQDADTTDADPCTDGSPHTVTVAWSEVDEGQARTSDVTLVVRP